MQKRLTRDPDNAILGGVAAGFANHFDVDPVLARLVFVLLCLLHGAGIVLYLISWVIMPVAKRPAAPAPAPGGQEGFSDEAGPAVEVEPAPSEGSGPGSPATPVDRFVDGVRHAGESAVEKMREAGAGAGAGQGRIFAGFFLIIIGLFFLLDRLVWFHWPWWLSFSKLWPLVLVFVGVAMILGRDRGRK